MDPGQHLLLQNQFRDTRRTVEQDPQNTGTAIPFKSIISGLKTYPDAHIIGVRAGEGPLYSTNEVITS